MKPPRSKRAPRPSPSAKPSGTPISPGRRWLFRLAAVVVGPVLFLLILEGGLRVASVGHPTSFFLPMQIDGKDCRIENDRFGWRFFGPELARTPFPFVIPRVKPENTIRVFVFGESAAYGDPQPEFGLSRLLKALLEGRYPDKHFEVVNTAMTGINSHVILPIARDCARQNGDFWVVYMGNNEVVGPYGSGTVFGSPAASLAVVRSSVALKSTRLAQMLEALTRNVQKRPTGQSDWGGMMMFLGNHVRQDDPRMVTVYTNFEQNLKDIISSGLRSGAKVLVSTVARNLKDCGPFASDHRLGISSDELSRWDNFFQTGIRAQEAGRLAEAVDSYRQAAQLDNTYAETHYRWGQCALALGQDAEAAREFTLACDMDTLRFRVDSSLNEITRRIASSKEQQGVQLVDSEALMASESPHHLIGGEFLYEHVHLNFEGNYLVARALVDQIGHELSASAEHPWPTADDCARRLGWNDFTRHEAETKILSRLDDSPFKEQADNRHQVRRLLQQIQQLQRGILPDTLRADESRTKAAADAAPGDWILQQNLAQLQEQIGDAAGALESLQHMTHLLPQSADAWDDLGLALDSAKRDDEAVSAFQTSIRLSPESVVSRNNLAELYGRQRHFEEATREFQQVLRQKPNWGPAHLGLGKVLEASGKTNEAKEQFDDAFKNRLRTPKFLNTLAKFSVSKGWYDAAVSNYSDSLRLSPSDPETHVALGLALAKLGKHPEAKAQYEEAVRLQPDFAGAHYCLGLELGAGGDATGATAQFTEVVRLKPEAVDAHLNLGIALFRQHLNDQAREQFDEVLRRDSKNQVALNYVRMLRGSVRGGRNQ